jgi:hypothetical protein
MLVTSQLAVVLRMVSKVIASVVIGFEGYCNGVKVTLHNYAILYSGCDKLRVNAVNMPWLSIEN